jgi:hypothetical protein
MLLLRKHKPVLDQAISQSTLMPCTHIVSCLQSMKVILTQTGLAPCDGLTAAVYHAWLMQSIQVMQTQTGFARP